MGDIWNTFMFNTGSNPTPKHFHPGFEVKEWGEVKMIHKFFKGYTWKPWQFGSIWHAREHSRTQQNIEVKIFNSKDLMDFGASVRIQLSNYEVLTMATSTNLSYFPFNPRNLEKVQVMILCDQFSKRELYLFCLPFHLDRCTIISLKIFIIVLTPLLVC